MNNQWYHDVPLHFQAGKTAKVGLSIIVAIAKNFI